MQSILEALVPIFLLIFLGYFFKRISFPAKEFWPFADKFTYYVLFPALLIYKLSNAKLDIDGFDFVMSAILAVIFVSVVLIILDKFALFFKGDAFTSVYQGAVRFNTYVFLALTDALFGDTGLVLAAFLMTFLIPTLNLFCISSFAMYLNNGTVNFQSFLKSVFTNPLILACLIGGAMNYLGITLMTPLENTVRVLSSAALPLGLLSVGVGLHFAYIKEVKFELFTALFLKLALMPAVIFFIGQAMGVQGLALSVLILFGAMPTASSAYILARQLGGDLKLMSSIITVQTLVSILTISVLLQVIQS